MNTTIFRPTKNRQSECIKRQDLLLGAITGFYLPTLVLVAQSNPLITLDLCM
jgi:hypothetical protein